MNTGPVLVDVAVKDLSGAALDWAAANAVGMGIELTGKYPHAQIGGRLEGRYHPSSSWAQCGPLIDKYKACFAAYDYGYLCLLAHNDLHHGQGKGPDHLTAACRAIVAAVLGDIVKVPACLVMP
jgi:hypothetical protein